MLEKLLASMGIGAATVDLEIPNPQVEPGESLNGTVTIKGGSVEQEVKKIEISLMLKSSYYENRQSRLLNREVSSAIIAENMVITPGYVEVIPVSFEIPFARNMPISKGRTRYYLQTKIDIRKAIDPVDHDDIMVIPNPYLKMFFDALATLGFREKDHSGDFDGVLQEFSYNPTTFFSQELEDIKVYAKVKKSEMDITIKLNKKNRGMIDNLVGDIDPNETELKFTLIFSKMENIQKVADYIKNILEEECRKV